MIRDKGNVMVPISQQNHRSEFTIDHTGRQYKRQDRIR